MPGLAGVVTAAVPSGVAVHPATGADRAGVGLARAGPDVDHAERDRHGHLDRDVRAALVASVVVAGLGGVGGEETEGEDECKEALHDQLLGVGLPPIYSKTGLLSRVAGAKHRHFASKI